MNEEQQPQLTDAEAKETGPEPPAETPTTGKKARKSSTTLVLIILMLVSVAALLLAGWAGYKTLDLQHQLHAEIEASNKKLKSLQTHPDIQLIRKTVQTAVSKMDAHLLQQEQQNKNIQTTLNRTQELFILRDRGWLLAEVEYLARVGVYRLELMRDVDGSVRALQNADQRLVALDDPTLIGLRRLFAQSIRLLRDLPRVDRIGLALQLDEMIQSLKPMALAPALSRTEAIKPEVEEERGWRKFPTILAAKLARFVTLRRHETPVAALPDAQTKQHIYQMLRLRMEAARLALMKEENAHFHQELQAVQRWLKQFFHPDESAALLTEIEELDALQLEPVWPDLSPLLQAIAKLHEEKNEAEQP